MMQVDITIHTQEYKNNISCEAVSAR